MKSLTKEEMKALDDKWTKLVAEYPKTRDECFMMLLDCCRNIAKSMCYGVRNTHIEEDALDATMYCIDCMDRLGHRPEKLSSYCYLRVKKFIYSQRRIREDREISWDELVEKQYFEERQLEGETNGNEYYYE